MAGKDPEYPKYNEYNNYGESNTGGLNESFRTPERNTVTTQAESEKNGEDAERNAVGKGGVRTGDALRNTVAAKLLAGIATGATSLAVFVLVFLLISVNALPKAKLTDIYAGADFIDYTVEAGDPGEYDMKITLSDSGGETVYEKAISEGENRATIGGLEPKTRYRLTVTGKSAFGRATAVSKIIKTAGTAPKAEIRNLRWAENMNGTVDVDFDIRFSDPSELFESSELVWVLGEGKDSGGEPVKPENTGYTIENFSGTGKFDVFLYCTVAGDKLLYSSVSVNITPVPKQTVLLSPGPDGRLFIRYSFADFGYDIDYFRIDFDDYGIRDITERWPAGKEYTYTAETSGGKVGMTVTLGYISGGRNRSTEERYSFNFDDAPHVTAGITSLSDSKDGLTVGIRSEGGAGYRKDLILSSSAGTLSFRDLKFDSDGTEGGEEATLTADLEPGVIYSAELRVYCYGDGFMPVPLGNVSHDSDVSFEIEFTDTGDLAFRLIYDDPNSYYGNFSATLTDGDTSAAFVYDSATGIFSLPAGSGWNSGGEKTRTVTVTADSSRPSAAPGTGITVAAVRIR